MRVGSPRLLREINDRAAIDALLHDGPLTRADLDERIGLSKPATAQLLTRLQDDGVIETVGLREGGRGPRAQLWAVRGELGYLVAAELTIGAVDIVLADITGRIHAELHAELPTSSTEAALSAFSAALRKATAKAGVTADQLLHVVLGSPGAVDPNTGRLGFAPGLRGWQGFDLPGRLGAELNTPVTVENDVNLVALEEMVTGRAAAIRDFVLVWPAAAVGGAVVLNRTLLRGAHGGAGEIDRMRVPDPSTTDTSAGPAGSRFGELLGNPATVRLARAHGISGRTGQVVVRKAVAAGQSGEAFLDDLASRISTGVLGIVSVLDPQLVLLAGQIAQAGGERLCALVGKHLHRQAWVPTPVELAWTQEDAVRAGALHVALANAREQLFGLSAAELLTRPQPRPEPRSADD
ncbi:putative NBD/HSP70 family sugar kinase [Tamaricihabitans halophyticus]|uniref:Putative NBD/HSP70 family sugar kinase n=1 Tax=Tamaricihabitans halophyticus TaxID=1262583 RepID=A0A4V2SUL3_9PSEU|nr:ROK family transcriptional regulator [Tamaricihabitans halophyticus]TCP55056.1 putative NBD/HSP70 family sugar kinase [Tamaricihabitans halophyticus]